MTHLVIVHCIQCLSQFRMHFKDINISKDDQIEIERLTAFVTDRFPTQTDIWKLTDKVWDELGCNNKKLDENYLARFYRHPIWLLSGLFIENDPLSIQHRTAIADWITHNRTRKNIKNVIDFGGGIGTLAKFIAMTSSDIKIQIYEPYCTNFIRNRIKGFPNIEIVNKVSSEYDCLVSTDVLEHVPDPLKLLYEMVQSVRTDGYLIIRHNFTPVIKCHLPSTFHLRFTFRYFAEAMGLRTEASERAFPACIYRNLYRKPMNWTRIRNLERISKLLFPFFKAGFIYYKVFRLFLR